MDAVRWIPDTCKVRALWLFAPTQAHPSRADDWSNVGTF